MQLAPAVRAVWCNPLFVEYHLTSRDRAAQLSSSESIGPGRSPQAEEVKSSGWVSSSWMHFFFPLALWELWPGKRLTRCFHCYVLLTKVFRWHRSVLFCEGCFPTYWCLMFDAWDAFRGFVTRHLTLKEIIHSRFVKWWKLHQIIPQRQSKM